MSESSTDPNGHVPEVALRPAPRGAFRRYARVGLLGGAVLLTLLAVFVIRARLVTAGLEGASRGARSLAEWTRGPEEEPTELAPPDEGLSELPAQPSIGSESADEIQLRPGGTASGPRPTLHVSEGTVAGWIRRGAVPSAASVPARGPLPAGVGIPRIRAFVPALLDEDRLVRVEGRAVGTPEDVVREVALALRAGRREVRATFAHLEEGKLVERVVGIPLPRESLPPAP